MTELSSEQERIQQRNKEIQNFCFVWETIAWKLIEAPLREEEKYKCPCCYYRTLEYRGGYDICPVCFWEDDGQDDADADSVFGGPNYELSLTQARQNYRTIGATRERVLKYVRSPLPEEW